VTPNSTWRIKFYNVSPELSVAHYKFAKGAKRSLGIGGKSHVGFSNNFFDHCVRRRRAGIRRSGRNFDGNSEDPLRRLSGSIRAFAHIRSTTASVLMRCGGQWISEQLTGNDPV
jgi:hypothetical protein